MPGEFKSQPNTARGVSVHDRTIRPIDFSSISKVASNVIGNTLQSRKDAQAAKVNQEFSEFATDVLDLQIERGNAQLSKEQLHRDVMALGGSGDIPEGDSQKWVSVNKQFESLQNAERQGILNPTVYNTKIRMLMKEAIQDAPALTNHFKSLFTDESLFSQDSIDPKSVAQASVTAKLDDMYGAGNYSADEYFQYIREQKLLADLNIDAATLEARQLSAKVPQYMSALTGPLTAKWATQLTANGGFLTPNQEETAELEFLQVRDQAMKAVNDLIASSDTRRKPLSITQQKALRTQVTDELSFIKSMIHEKDALTAIKSYNDLKTAAWEFQNPEVLRVSKAFFGGGGDVGIKNISQLASALKDPTIYSLFEQQGAFDVLKEAGYTPQDFLVKLTSNIFQGISFNDPTLKRQEKAMTALLTTKGVQIEGIDVATNKILADGTTTEDLIALGEAAGPNSTFSAKVSDNLNTLKNKNFARNHMLNMDQQSKKEFGNLVDTWYVNTINSIDQDMVQKAMEGTEGTVTFDHKVGRFVKGKTPTVKDTRFLPGGVHVIPREVQILNSFLELRETSPLAEFFPTREDIIRKLNDINMQAQGFRKLGEGEVQRGEQEDS